MPLALQPGRWSLSGLRLPGVPVLGLAAPACLLGEQGRLALWLPVGLGAGVLAYFALRFEPDAAWRWAALPPLVLALLLARRRPLAAWGCGLLAAAALGVALASWHAARQPPLSDLPRGAVVLSGRVATVDRMPEGLRLTLATPRLDDGEPLPRQIRVRLRPSDPARPRPGDRVTVRALVRAPAPPAYPGAWDFQRNAFFSGLGGSGFALGPADLQPGEGGERLAKLRSEIEARVGAALPGAPGAVAAALLTGGQSAIPAPALAAMRDSGLAHLLSVSGLHISIVMGVSFMLARLLLALWPWLALRLPGKPAAAVLSLGAGGFYLLLTGSGVPMQRSFAMAALVTLALLTGRRAISLRALGLAAVAVLLLNPAALLGPSFQMSFAAVLALIAGWEALRPRVRAMGEAAERGWRRRLLLAVAGLMLTSVLAGAATTPFGLHHFGRLQLYGVAANALAVPITSLLIMPAGMLAMALMPFGMEALALAPMGWGVEAVLWVAAQVAVWPGAALSLRPMPAEGLLLLSFGMLWLCLWRGGWRWWGVPMMVFGLAAGAWHRPPDLLVSADARLIAVRHGQGVWWQRQSGASSLTRESWLRHWGAAGAEALPRAGQAADGAITCASGHCVLQAAPRTVLLRGDAPWDACRGAALVISAEPVRGRCAAQVVDRFTVWREGAQAVWLRPDGAVVLSDRAYRGERPWVPPPPQPRAASEPMAQTE